MGGLLTKHALLQEKNWVFPIHEAIRQVVPPEYADLEDTNDEEVLSARAIQASRAFQQQLSPDGERGSSEHQTSMPSHLVKTPLKFYRFFADWLPRLRYGPAIVMLLLDSFLPGFGTMIFSIKWFSPEDYIIPTTRSQRSAIVFTCFLYGFMQLLLAPFIFGWLWSITTGVLAVQQARWVAISETYSNAIEHRLKGMLGDRREAAREDARHIHLNLNSDQNNRSPSSSDETGPIGDISLPSSAHSTHRPPLNGDGNQGEQLSQHQKASEGDVPFLFARPHQQTTTPSASSSQIRPLPPINQPMANKTESRRGKPKTPKSSKLAKRNSNDIHPTEEVSHSSIIAEPIAQPLTKLNDPIPQKSVDEPEVSKEGHARQNSATSHASSRKSHKSALSLSLNRISPAPTPASKLLISSSAGGQDRSSMSSSSETPSSQEEDTPHNAVVSTRSLPQSQQKAWTVETTVKPPPPPPDEPAIGAKPNEDSSSDDVIIDLHTPKERQKKSPSPTLIKDPDYEDIEDIF